MSLALPKPAHSPQVPETYEASVFDFCLDEETGVGLMTTFDDWMPQDYWATEDALSDRGWVITDQTFILNQAAYHLLKKAK